MRSKLNYNLLRTFCVVVLPLLAIGQNESQREFRNSWSGIKSVAVTHRYGDLEVLSSPDNTVTLEALITVRAKNQADAKLVVEHFKIDQREMGDQLELQTEFDSKAWSQNGNNITIKFIDGSKAKDIQDVNITYKLYVPALEELKLSNKYNDILIHENITAERTHFKLYDAHLEANNISGDLKLEIKYGSGDIASVADAEILLYDSELKIKNAINIDFTTKYSEFFIGQCSSLDLTSYDDDGKIESIEGDLVISDKYSEFTIGKAGSANVSIYDGDIRVEETGSWAGRSKYSEIKVGNVENFKIDYSYDDDIELNSAAEFECPDSKYSNYVIRTLKRKLVLRSFDDDISVKAVDPAFELLDIEAKYSSLHIPLNTVQGYSLNVEARYGEIRYPDPSDRDLIHKETNDKLEVRASIGKEGSEAEAIIKAYDSDIKLY